MIHGLTLKLNSWTDSNGDEMDEPKSLDSLFKENSSAFRITSAAMPGGMSN